MVLFSFKNGLVNQYITAISGSMCYTIMGASTAWPSPTLVKMEKHETPIVLDVTEISWMVSLMFLGHITSPIPTGYLMDWFGRKRTCLSLSVLPFLSWLLIFFAKSTFYLYIARFTAGLWIGVITTVMPLYVCEISGPELRNSLTTINNMLLNLGVLFVYVVGPYVSYYTLSLACEALTVVYFCMFITMPESPYYLIKHERRKEAYEVLSWLRKGDPEEDISNEISRIRQSLEDQRMQKGTLKEIFCDKGNRKAFNISISYAIIKRLSGAGVLQAYTSITLPKISLGLLNPDTCVIIIGFISFFSSLASTFLAVKYRRRILLTVSAGGCAISTTFIMVWMFLNYKTSIVVSRYSDVVFLSLALYYTVFNIGLGPVGSSIKGEVFAANVKALSSSLTTLVVAFTGFLINKFYLIIASSMGMYVNFLIFSVSSFAAIILTWTYVPDTHNKTLEDIRLLLRGEVIQKYSSTS